MKTPYLKFYTADLLAHTRHLTPTQIGEAVIAVCEQAFGNPTAYTPRTSDEKACYKMLCAWKKQSTAALRQKKKAARLGGITTQQKNKNVCPAPEPHDGETSARSAQPPLLQQFSQRVLDTFEPQVKTPEQKHIWFKRNCRALRDILTFCDGDPTLAAQTVKVCRERLAKAGLTGGYEAVCRLLPDYYAEAKRTLSEQARRTAEAEKTRGYHLEPYWDAQGHPFSRWVKDTPPEAGEQPRGNAP